MSKLKLEKVKVEWLVAVKYGVDQDLNKLSLTQRVTEGELIRQDKNFLLIKNPKTWQRRGEQWELMILDEPVTFYVIPRGAVKNLTILH